MDSRADLDFLDIEARLTDEQREVVKTVRAFVTSEVQPLIRLAYRNEVFPEKVIPGLGRLGLLGSNLPLDSQPMDAISYGLAMRELERCDSGLRSFVSVQSGLVMYPIYAFGTEEQKKQWLPVLQNGTAIGCFGLTESEGGSDPSAMRTTAEKKGTGWVLNGSKMWITNGNLAQVAIVWAKTEGGIRGFLVPTQTSGFTVRKMEGKLSLRASVTSELHFDNVQLPESALLPKAVGLKAALQCLSQARYSIVWGVLGAAEACFLEALNFSKERILFGKKLAAFQLTQRKLATLCAQITQGQLVAYRLGELKNAGTMKFPQISLAKQINVEMALQVARVCRDILGANGIMDEYQTMRHLCNLETVYTYEGTNDIHLLIVGAELTGEQAFS